MEIKGLDPLMLVPEGSTSQSVPIGSWVLYVNREGEGNWAYQTILLPSHSMLTWRGFAISVTGEALTCQGVYFVGGQFILPGS